MLIDWSKLQPYKRTKQKSFEQFCYQIVAKLFCDQGTLTSIDDSGGGDGVEFYITFENGNQFGWQAKFYEAPARLNVSNRKQNIIKSLKRAIEVHPQLEKWYLCLPTDLTNEENNWIQKDLKKHIPQNRSIEIEPWDESKLHELINRPNFNGLKQAFFNSLELSPVWFQEKFENLFTIVKNKFDDLLYVPNEEFEYWSVNPVLCNKKFKEQRIKYYPEKLNGLYEKCIASTKKLKNQNLRWRPLLEKYNEGHVKFIEQLKSTLPEVESRFKNINPNDITYLSDESLQNAARKLQAIRKELEEFRIAWYKENVSENQNNQDQGEKIQFRQILDIESIYREVLEELNYYISHSAIPVDWRIAHYLGNGGTGKTNFCVGLAKEYLQLNHPIIFIPAIKLTGQNPLSEQILSLLDIKTGYSFSDFLDCLNELGKIHNVRVPLIFDGLNEALNVNGFFNEKLSSDLPGLQQDILRRENLVLLTTCRSSYREKIWPASKIDDEQFHSLYGFTNPEDKKKLVRKYFEHYKIQADLSFLSLDRFTKPIYLKIFCESTNQERKGVKQVTLGFDSIYSIFENFIAQCDRNVFDKIIKTGKLPPTSANKSKASQALREISKHLWEQPSRSFSLEELMEIADGKTDIDYSKSITKALLDEELLFIRNWNENEEVVYLTYDLLAGYLIAKHLLSTTPDFKDFFNSPDQLASLINQDDKLLHPNHEDILEGLCSLLPIKKGIFVHDLINPIDPKNLIHQKLLKTSLSATVLLSPEFIPGTQVSFIKELSVRGKNLYYLLHLSEEVRFVSNHPFNFSFWSDILRQLPMNDRDTIWSEYLRNTEISSFDSITEEFEYLQELSQLSEEQTKKIDLVAELLFWTFTSTSGILKEKSAKELYAYGIKFPDAFLRKFYAAAGINDPSLFEWANLVLYNVVLFVAKMSSQTHKRELIAIADFLFNQVLTENSRYATNNLITRNYAFSTYKLLYRKFDKEIDFGTPESISKKFKKVGIIQWEESEDLNEGDYRDGNSLIDYFFDKEKMPYVIVGMGNEYNRTPEFLSTQAKLRWRAYQLGYRFDLFGDKDKEIAKYKHYGELYNKTERYADKYIGIAFMEYCGFLAAQGKLKSYEDVGSMRTFKPRIDPTCKEVRGKSNERIVKANYINCQVSLQQWCTDHSVPDLTDYLIRNDFTTNKDNFVLLHGLLHQHNKSFERQIFFQVDTIFVKNRMLNQARQAFQKSKKFGWGDNSAPTTSHIHESEIPDADIIPYNEFTDWYYSISSKKVERVYKKYNLIQDGKMLDELEADFIWKTVLSNNGFIGSSRESRGDFIVPAIRFSAPGTKEVSLEEAFERMGIRLEEVPIKKTESEEIEKTLPVFIPVRQLKGKFYLCKNIIEECELSSKVHETDLLDQYGVLASFNHTFEMEYVDQETFTYLRKDLLDRYLLKKQLTMFIIIWGERDYYPPDGDWTARTEQLNNRRWSDFYGWEEYKIEKA